MVLGAGAFGTTRLTDEEDLLVFLPQDDADVRLFRDVSRRFGALRVALVGVEAPPGEDVFQAGTIRRIDAATRALRNTIGVDRVMSLTTVTQVTAGPLGAEVRPLVEGPPANEAEHQALRARALGQREIVGHIVSRDGRAAVIMVYLADAAGRSLTRALRDTARQHLSPLTLRFGGGPFAGDEIYGEARADLRRLSPIALAILFFVVVLSFRDWVGVALTLASVAFGTVVVLGAMGFAGEKLTVVTSTLPVILFASGSAFPIHVLGRYYLSRERLGPREAAADAVRFVAAPVTIDTATTAIGFLAFLVMDVRPMRAFGLACGAGIVLCWLAALALVPAVLVVFPRRSPPREQLRWLGQVLTRVWHGSARRGVPIAAAAMALFVLALLPTARVEVRMDPRAFYRVGSEAWQADRFLEERFGGATFVQVPVRGDVTDPATLRAIAELVDYARALPGVTQVSSVIEPLLQVSSAMGVGRRLPETRAQAANLFFFLEGETGMSSLYTPDRDEALVHVRLRGDARPIVQSLEAYVRDGLRAEATPGVDGVVRRIGWVAAAHGARPEARALDGVLRGLALPGEDDPEVAERIAREEDPAQARRDEGVARAVTAVARAAGLGAVDRRLREDLEPVLDDLFLPAQAQPARPIVAQVAGEPVLDRGFARSVGSNQLRSVVVAVAFTLVFLALLFRSLRLALICWFPAQLTLALLFGFMGLAGVHVDLGTSMVTGSAVGVGADFAMHYMWYLRRSSPDEVSREVAPVGLLAVVLIALGFAVLGLGRSPVTRTFGLLSCASTLASAVATCVLLPALLRLKRPRR